MRATRHLQNTNKRIQLYDAVVLDEHSLTHRKMTDYTTNSLQGSSSIESQALRRWFRCRKCLLVLCDQSLPATLVIDEPPGSYEIGYSAIAEFCLSRLLGS